MPAANAEDAGNGSDSDNSTISTESNTTLGLRRTFKRSERDMSVNKLRRSESDSPTMTNTVKTKKTKRPSDDKVAIEAFKSLMSLLNLVWITSKMIFHIVADIAKKQCAKWIHIIQSPDIWMATFEDVCRYAIESVQSYRLRWIRQSARYAKVDSMLMHSWHWVRFRYIPITGESAAYFLNSAKANGIVLLVTGAASDASNARYQGLNSILDQPDVGHLHKKLAIVWIRSTSSRFMLRPKARLHGPNVRLNLRDNSPIIDLRKHKIVIDADLSNLKHVVWVDRFLHSLCNAGFYSILNAVWTVGIDEFAELNQRSTLYAEYLGQVALTRAVSDLFKSGIGMTSAYKRIVEEESLPILSNALQAPNALPPSEQFELDLYIQNLRLKGMNMMLSKEAEKPQERPRIVASSKQRHSPTSSVSDSKESTPTRESRSSSPQKANTWTAASQTRRVNLKGASTSSLFGASEMKINPAVPSEAQKRQSQPMHEGGSTRRLSQSSQHRRAQNSFSSALDEILKT